MGLSLPTTLPISWYPHFLQFYEAILTFFNQILARPDLNVEICIGNSKILSSTKEGDKFNSFKLKLNLSAREKTNECKDIQDKWVIWKKDIGWIAGRVQACNITDRKRGRGKQTWSFVYRKTLRKSLFLINRNPCIFVHESGIHHQVIEV